MDKTVKVSGVAVKLCAMKLAMVSNPEQIINLICNLVQQHIGKESLSLCGGKIANTADVDTVLMCIKEDLMFGENRCKNSTLSRLERYNTFADVKSRLVSNFDTVSPITKTATSAKSFAAFLRKDADMIIQKIGRIIPGCKGKKVATIIRALQELGYITLASGEYKQLYRAIRADYNIDIGADSGITKYLSGANQIPEREMEDMKKQLQ